jgi:hypothetical protein
MAAFLSNERRLVMRVLELWENLRGARRFPSVSDVESADIGADWASCFVIAVGARPELSSFHYVGGGLLVPDWDEATGRAVADCPDHTVLRHASSYMTKVIHMRVPISIGGDFDVDESRIVYRSIILPLSDDGTLVNFLFGAANCRLVASAGGLASATDNRQAGPGGLETR